LTSDEELRHAFDALGDRLRDVLVREVHATTAEVVAVEQRRRAEEKAEAVRLLDACRAIDAAPSLTAALTALLDAAAHDDTRVVLLLRRSTRLRVWSVRGVDPVALAEGAELDETAPLGEAIRAGRARSGDGSDAPLAMMAEPEREWIAAPIVLAGEAVAVLYADRRISDAQPSSWTEGVEMIVGHAAKALEAVAAFKTAASLLKTSDRLATAGAMGHR
jgi:hypothetical protein